MPSIIIYELALNYKKTMTKKLIAIFTATLLALSLVLMPLAALANTNISITSPTSGSSINGTSFTITGTATAGRNVVVKVNGISVGSTVSDGSGNWSVNVTGQSVGAKSIEATASGQTLYTNVASPSALSAAHMSKINTVTNTQAASFSTISSGLPFLVWKPNSTFTKAYGTAPYLSSPNVWVIDLVNETVSNFTMAGVNPRAASIAFSGDDSKVYIADNENAVEHVYNTTTNAEIGSGITVGTVGVSHPHGTIHRPNHDEIWETNGGDGEISVINTNTDTVIHTYSGFVSPNSTAFSPDGAVLYSSNSTGIDLINADTGAIIDTISSSNGQSPEYLLVNTNGTKLYASYPSSNIVDVFNTSSHAVISTITVGTGPWGEALNADDSRLYVANPNLLGGLNGTTVSVIDTSNNTVIDSITTAGGPFMIFAAPPESSSQTISLTLTTASANTLASTGDSSNLAILISFGLILSSIAGIYILSSCQSN